MTSDDAKSRPHVIAVVLTWNDTDMVKTCIRSVLANSYEPKAVVLVDNGSHPPAWPVIKETFPFVEVVPLPENMGFTGGCNRGIERALDLGADYIFLLNNDTVVHEQAIAHLVRAMEARPDVAMASAVLLFPGEERRVQFYRSRLLRDCARHVRFGEGETLAEKHRGIIETEFAPACAVLFRPEALRQVGLFDERLFTNWEDYDLCCRFLDAGWKLVTVGDAEVVHAHGKTTGRISPFITYFFARNRLVCLFRYGRPWGILRNALPIARTFFHQMRAYGLTNWPAHRAFLCGIADFLLGIRGKGHAPENTRDKGDALDS